MSIKAFLGGIAIAAAAVMAMPAQKATAAPYWHCHNGRCYVAPRHIVPRLVIVAPHHRPSHYVVPHREYR